MLRLNILGFLAAVTFFEAAHALNACPVADTVFTGTQGIRYRVCPDTDLVGDSTSITANIASTTACAQACDQNINCFKAVYDTQTRDCHIKANGNQNWVDNARFDVIQAEQVNIARCPYTETTYTGGGVSHANAKSYRTTLANDPILAHLQDLPRY
mgnify:CR=1 FL=1|tara:strand:- start:10472 stop:10939 length:468 start_codon:yes stop_codon:yes gene_type:complete